MMASMPPLVKVLLTYLLRNQTLIADYHSTSPPNLVEREGKFDSNVPVNRYTSGRRREHAGKLGGF